MTGQIGDVVVYQGERYSLAGENGSALFEPAQLGLEVYGWSTASYRGYHCIYSVIDQALYLTKAHLGLAAGHVEAMQRGEREAVFGKIPHRYTIEGDQINFRTREVKHYVEKSPEYVVDDIQVAIPFSGGLLIGRDFIRGMYVHAGFQAPYRYNIVHELIFEAGYLTEAVDRSHEVAEFRSTMLGQSSLDTMEDHLVRIKAWVTRRFKFMYGSFAF